LKVLFLGDVIGKPGRNALKKKLDWIIGQNEADLVIANGENSSGGIGITIKTCKSLFESGVVEYIGGQTSIIIVDMHAEATSEKVAMGWYLNERVSAVIGTHTHIQTADERILPGRTTAYITDVGMVGPRDSVIGVIKENIIEKFLTNMPQKFTVAKRDVWINGVVMDIDEKTGKTKTIKRINYEVDGGSSPGSSIGLAK